MNKSIRGQGWAERVLHVHSRRLVEANIQVEPRRRLIEHRQASSARSVVARLSETTTIRAGNRSTAALLGRSIGTQESCDGLGRDALGKATAERVKTDGVILSIENRLNRRRRTQLGSGSVGWGESISIAVGWERVFESRGSSGNTLSNLRSDIGYRCGLLVHAIGTTLLGDIAVGISEVASIGD